MIRLSIGVIALYVVAALAVAALFSAAASAGTSCTTRKSGSVTITTCSGRKFHSQCRSYRSGSVIKTSCR